MIQDTTLRMVVQAIDQASAPLDAVKDRIDGLSGSLDNTKESAERSLPAIGEAAESVVDDFDDLGRSAGNAASMIGPGMAQAAIVAAGALVALYKYLKDAADEHERIRGIAETLSLPYDTVKDYSEAWLEVARALSEAARGYKELGDAQQVALNSIGLDPGNLREADVTKTFIALGNGTNLEKVDALRRLFGLNDEKALAIIKEENRKFFGEVANKLQLSEQAFRAVSGGDDRGVSPDIAQRVRSFKSSAGVGLGDLDVSRLASRIPTPNEARNLRSDQAAAESAIKEINSSLEQEQRKALAAAESAERKAANERLQRRREEFDQQIEFMQQGTRIIEDEAKSMAKVLADNDKAIAKSSSEAWKTISEQTGRELKELQFPVNQFVEDWKDAMKQMVYYGDFSFKRLIAQVIINITSRKLFEAIDRMGDALSDALSGGGGGGKGSGFLRAAGSFLGGLFGGNAGGGQESGLRWVGEEGPELVASGPNAMRVYNMRQLASGSSGGGQQSMTYYDHRTYNISGVETQQVVAYIEQTRRDDQRANLRMLERNGLGSMR
jgi:hypothetical protein